MITYDDLSHTYYNDGALIPSVSELVAFALNEDYSDVPIDYLEYAQRYGTLVHEAIQNYLEKGKTTEFDDPYMQQSFNSFLDLNVIQNPKCEFIVDYKGRYAGRIDCLSDDILIDFKTNTVLNEPHLRLQTGFYKLALESKGTIVNECKCLWLPKRKYGKWVAIEPTPENELLEILEEYEKQKNESLSHLPFC